MNLKLKNFSFWDRALQSRRDSRVLLLSVKWLVSGWHQARFFILIQSMQERSVIAPFPVWDRKAEKGIVKVTYWDVEGGRMLLDLCPRAHHPCK